jgi:hypothetical protein
MHLPSLRSITIGLSVIPLAVACSPAAPVTGTGGAPGSGGQVGSGGAANTGGSQNSGGTVGTGGAPNSGGAANSGGTAGSGGENATGGTPGSGGAGSGGQSGGDCSSLPVCDDFEGVTAGMPPDPVTWTTELNYADNGDPALVTVSSDDARSPTRSVKVAGNDTAPWNFQYAAPGETFYARAHIKTADPGSSGTAVIGVGLGSTHGDEIRLRFFGGKVTLNSASGGDGLAPDPSVCTDCLDVPVDTWFCAEMFYDSTTDTARIWIDGELAAEVVNNTGWHSGGSFPIAADRIWFGTLAPNGAAPTVFFDDVAVGPSQIGCQ